MWSLMLFINGELKGEYSGLKFFINGIMGIYNWNKDDYFLLIINLELLIVYKLVVVVIFFKLLLFYEKLCMYGLFFRDDESGIKEFYFGLLDLKYKNKIVIIFLF